MTEPESNPETHNNTPDWLERLQNDSWQAEVLISGGAFVGLISVFNSIVPLMNSLMFSSKVNALALNFLIIVLVASCLFMTVGFLIHLILRGYWIGLIGLNYAFPIGINKERLAFKGSFTNFIRGSSNIPLILKIDKICGGIFAFTFISFMSCIGLVLLLGFSVLVFYLATFPHSKTLAGITAFVLLFTLLTSLIDYLTFGWIKRIKWFSRIYYPIHFLVSWVTLSVIYRRMYYTLTSNIKWRYLFLSLFLLQILIFTALLNTPDGKSGLKSILPKRSGIGVEGNSEFLSIKDEVVTGQTLEVSLNHFLRLEDSMLEIWKRNKGSLMIDDFSELSAKDKLILIDSTYRIFIDDRPFIKGLKWSPRVLQNNDNIFAPERTILKTRINVDDLASGQHELKVKIISTNEMRDLGVFMDVEKLGYNAKIFFYIERPEEKANGRE